MNNKQNLGILPFRNWLEGKPYNLKYNSPTQPIEQLSKSVIYDQNGRTRKITHKNTQDHILFENRF